MSTLIRNHLMRYLASTIFVIFSILLSGCFGGSSSPEETQHNNPAPIVEIRERLALPLPESFDKLALVLSRYDLHIPDGLSANGQFSTTSVKVKDRICTAQFLNNAPVTCDLKIHGKLTAINDKSTLLNLTYREHCLDQRHINNICKDSNAEKLLFSIHKDIK